VRKGGGASSSSEFQQGKEAIYAQTSNIQDSRKEKVTEFLSAKRRPRPRLLTAASKKLLRSRKINSAQHTWLENNRTIRGHVHWSL
jgi:hypothetical protein